MKSAPRRPSFCFAKEALSSPAPTSASSPARRRKRNTGACSTRSKTCRSRSSPAMHGTVMGGGLEIALACHYRVAAPGTRFGLPEVTLGIIPGAGGTQRMPRLIGVEKTLELVLGARPVDAAKAIELGFLDKVVERRSARRRGWNSRARCKRRAARENCRRPPRATEIIARFTVAGEKAVPQPARAASPRSRRSPPPRPCRLRRAWSTKPNSSTEPKRPPSRKALVHVFFAERETRRIPGIGPEVKARAVKSAAIVGAGTMGGGIAICFANAGIPVTVLDATQDGLDRGLAVIDKTYESMVQRGRLTARGQGEAPRAHRRRPRLRPVTRCRRRHRGGVREPGA